MIEALEDNISRASRMPAHSLHAYVEAWIKDFLRREVLDRLKTIEEAERKLLEKSASNWEVWRD